MNIIGILLAAGSGRRFDPSGLRNKLLAPLANNTPVAVSAAANMLSVLTKVIAVVPDANGALATELRLLGCDVTACPNARHGMAASLVHALRHCPPGADGWLIALADMPHVRPATIAALCVALTDDPGIAAPFHAGRRGNPVAFHRRWRDQLLKLEGDQGARALLAANRVTGVEVIDPGIFHDIDTFSDLG